MEASSHNRATTVRTVAIAAGFLFAVGIAMLWAWNTLAVGLFDAPAAEFRHALALEVGLIALGSLAGFGQSMHHRRAH